MSFKGRGAIEGRHFWLRNMDHIYSQDLMVRQTHKSIVYARVYKIISVISLGSLEVVLYLSPSFLSVLLLDFELEKNPIYPSIHLLIQGPVVVAAGLPGCSRPLSYLTLFTSYWGSPRVPPGRPGYDIPLASPVPTSRPSPSRMWPLRGGVLDASRSQCPNHLSCLLVTPRSCSSDSELPLDV